MTFILVFQYDTAKETSKNPNAGPFFASWDSLKDFSQMLKKIENCYPSLKFGPNKSENEPQNLASVGKKI